MNRRLLITISIAIVLILGTYVAIQFAKGYRPDFTNGNIKGTGLLVVNSSPRGAQVFIDDKLTTATDDTLNLSPGEYKIEIKKDGYINWSKTIQIEAELVTQANARLFPAVTSLHPLTFTGVTNVIPSPDGQKIVYAVTESSSEANKGLWVLDLVERPLSLSKDPSQIVMNTPNLDFTKAELGWSPDSSQVLTHFPKDPKNRLSTEANILLEANSLNRTDSLRDVTARLTIIFSQWEEQLAQKLNNQLLNLPLELQAIATSSATNVYFSPDEKKLLYTATKALTLSENLIPPLPSSNSQPEERQLQPGSVYIYDLEEDKNYKIIETSLSKDQPTRLSLVDLITPKTLFSPTSSPSAYRKLQQQDTSTTILNFKNQYTPIDVQNLQWFPDSKHLILSEENKIITIEYDGTNQSTVYAGSYESNFTFPWPDGSKLLIITNLNTESSIPPNLYVVDLL